MINRRQISLALLAFGAGSQILSQDVFAADPSDAAARPLNKSKVEKWLAGYRAAWEGRDSEKAVALFTPTAHYRDSAFEDTMVGRDAIRSYWIKSVSNQKDIKFDSTLWSVSGLVATSHWAAQFMAIDTKKPVKLDGVFHLAFEKQTDGTFLCSELLEWWFVG